MHYTPDPSIVRQLKESDPDLDVRWDQTDERWWVTCLGKNAIKVREPDGSYRPLDGRIVTRLREEAWIYRSKFGRLHMHDKQLWQDNAAIKRQEHARQRDDFHYYAKSEMYPRVVGVGGTDGRNKFAGWSASA